MTRYTSILFDLDGTLSRSAPGITRSLQYGLRRIGIDEPDLSRLTRFIGPPLNVELRAAYGLSAADIERVISGFRERYEAKGLYECELYPGVGDLVRDCAAAGLALAVASSKPEPHVKTIMAHFGLTGCFRVIKGSRIEDELDNKTGADNKEKIVAGTLALLRQSGADGPAVMIGDTRYDITGARRNGIDSVAVTYGYGTAEELADCRRRRGAPAHPPSGIKALPAAALKKQKRKAPILSDTGFFSLLRAAIPLPAGSLPLPPAYE